MAFKAFGIILLAVIAPYLYDSWGSLKLFYTNSPERLVKINTFKSHEIKFADRIRSCEDVLLVEDKGVAILACDPGREKWNTVMGVFLPEPIPSASLYIYNYKDVGLPDDEALKKLAFVGFEGESDFHTLGLAYNETSSTLLAASHRHDFPAVEMFKLDLQANTATHLRSIQHPLVHGPNSIIWKSEHEFYVTNNNHFLAAKNPVLSKLEIYLGLPLGSVVHVDFAPVLEDADATPIANVVARVPFANGIELLHSKNSNNSEGKTTAVVASTSKARLYFFDVSEQQPKNNLASPVSFTRSSEVHCDFFPDNLAVSKDGALMIAGHPHAPSLGKFTKTRHVCNSPEEELAKADPAMQETCRTFSAPSWAARWTPERGIENLYADLEYATSATAVRDSDRGMGIISGLYAHGILVWKE